MDRARKEVLVKELAEQRGELCEHYLGLRQKLDLGRQFRLSVKKHPTRWVAVSAGTAFLGMRLLRRKKVVYKEPEKERGLFFRTSKLAFNLARPALTAMALKYAREFAEARLQLEQENSMLGDPPQK